MVSLLVAASAVIMLAGCAPAPSHPASPHTGSPGSATPAAVPTAPVAPGWAYGIGCEDLIPSSTVQSHIVAPVSVKYDEHSVPATTFDVAFADAGGLKCVWGGTNRTDSSYDDGLTLMVLPQAAAEYASWVAAGGTPGCSINACIDGGRLVESTWVSIVLSDSERTGGNSANLSADDVAVAAHVADALGHLGTRGGLWSPPAGADTGARFCQADEAARLANAFADTSNVSLDNVPAVPSNDLLSVALARGGFVSCGWTVGGDHSIGSLAISTVPGGAWASARMYASPPAHYPFGQYSAVSIAGATGAVAGCGDGCQAMFSVSDSFYAFSAQTTDLQTFLPQVGQFVASMTH